MIVTPAFAIISVKRIASWLIFRSTNIDCAPDISGMYSSRPAISKPSVVSANTLSAALQPIISRIDQQRLTTPLCATITPLGVPVEPEV